jgi:hypothetical protein
MWRRRRISSPQLFERHRMSVGLATWDVFFLHDELPHQPQVCELTHAVVLFSIRRSTSSASRGLVGVGAGASGGANPWHRASFPVGIGPLWPAHRIKFALTMLVPLTMARRSISRCMTDENHVVSRGECSKVGERRCGREHAGVSLARWELHVQKACRSSCPRFSSESYSSRRPTS